MGPAGASAVEDVSGAADGDTTAIWKSVTIAGLSITGCTGTHGLLCRRSYYEMASISFGPAILPYTLCHRYRQSLACSAVTGYIHVNKSDAF